MKIGNKEFDTAKHTYIMGILNVTPDSFSDGGKWNGYDAAMRHAEELLEGGTDILDIGGESTRPGHQQMTSEEEITRTAPVIEAVKKNFDVPVSIDTYKSDVAEAALQAGADLVNDIWGFQYDEKMAGLVKKYDAACCLMHNKNEAVYKDFLKDMYAELQKCVDTAKAAGIEDDRIMLDPGVGFGKTYEMNLDVMKHLENCPQAVLLAVTLGPGVDAQIRRAGVGDIAAGVASDALGSALAEQAADAAEAELRQWAAKEGKYLTGRFSPGYGDWDIAVQPLVANALDTVRRAGLCVTDTNLMTPRKSVTAILGVSGHPVKGKLAGCGHCVLRTRCEYRKRGKTCASE